MYGTMEMSGPPDTSAIFSSTSRHDRFCTLKPSYVRSCVPFSSRYGRSIGSEPPGLDTATCMARHAMALSDRPDQWMLSVVTLCSVWPLVSPSSLTVVPLP